MGNLGKLCRSPSGSLEFKYNSTPLVYKGEAGDWTMVSMAWGVNGKDLDIRACWSDGGNVVGFKYNSGAGDYSADRYGLQYSGDIKSASSSEWVKIRKSPWGGESRFIINLNYYGYSKTYNANTCTVIASQLGGETLIKNNVPCATRPNEPAYSSDPGVAIVFDSKGKLSRIELIN